MTLSTVANVLMIATVIALWSLVIFWILPNYRVDSFRQKMFTVRDKLFDYAAEGSIPFDEPAYVLLRQHMNGFIRYAHQLTVFRLLMTKVINNASAKSGSTRWSDAWCAALANVKSDEARARLKALYEEGTVLTIKHLILGSPLLWTAMTLVGFGLLCHGAALGTRQLLKAAASRVMVGPLDRRVIDETVAATAG